MAALLAEHARLIEADWREGFSVPPLLTASAWSEANVDLPANTTDWPGLVSFDRTPYIREPLDAYGDPAVEEIIWCAASQVGKSLFQQCAICYTIAHRPAPTLFVMPNEPDAKSFSKARLLPLFRGASEIAAKIGDEADLTQLEMTFRGCTLNIVGSNSPARLASRPIANLFCDEIDKFAPSSGREASALNLAMNRTRKRLRKKHVFTSTPTLDTAAIWTEFLKGDQRYFFLPCPHCRVFDHLRFENVRWPASCKRPDGKWSLEALGASAFYQCPHCSGRIDDEDKPRMLTRGEWRPTAEGIPRRLSYHLNGLYPPWASWGKLAVEFISKKDNLDDLRDFRNSALALPWHLEVEKKEAREILERREDYAPGTIPFEPLEVILTSDKQALGYWYVVRAWGEGEISALVEAGFCETDADLLAISRTHYRGPKGLHGVTFRLMDSGDFTDEVYAFCKRHRWQALKGYGQGAQTNAAKYGPNPDCGRLLTIYTEFCKEALAGKLNIPPGRPGCFLLHRETDSVYAAHMTSEIIVEHPDGTRERKTIGPNHLYDCEVYNFAAAVVKRVRYRTHEKKAGAGEDDDRSFVKPRRYSSIRRESEQ